MNDIPGGLIQMNAHMVTKSGASAVMMIGGMVTLLFFVLTICAIAGPPNKEGVIAFAVMTALGVGLFFAGRAIPKVKEIHACASGPVSMEQVATRYIIVKVDGKELILRER